MNIDQYLATEEAYPDVIANAVTCYALRHLHKMYRRARRTNNADLLQLFATGTSRRQNVCGWVSGRLAEKVLDTDLIERIMADIKWSYVLTELQTMVEQSPISDSDSEDVPSLPPMRSF